MGDGTKGLSSIRGLWKRHTADELLQAASAAEGIEATLFFHVGDVLVLGIKAALHGVHDFLFPSPRELGTKPVRLSRVRTSGRTWLGSDISGHWTPRGPGS